MKSLRDQQGDFTAEYIFIDDVSTDHSKAVLREIMGDCANFHLIENTVNAGPAIRLNQGAKIARGKYLALFDCDEILAPNAVSTLLALARNHDADMVHGKWQKTTNSIDKVTAEAIPPTAPNRVFDDPLARVLGRGMVRMTWLVEQNLFLQAGGCDEQVFVQDESFRLRLAAKAKRLVDSEAIITMVPDVGSHVSSNNLQLHHDRFFIFYNFLTEHPDLPAPTRRKLVEKCISAARKARRDGAKFPLISVMFHYLRAKAGLATLTPDSLAGLRDQFLGLNSVRRPSRP
ncbi:MAG: glycosyltransferase [Thalassospira sp.]|nr:glycosyltransferase [Thalassospira sp.]MDP2699177.1 glycosyltransferase [Thalassospira sp.]